MIHGSADDNNTRRTRRQTRKKRDATVKNEAVCLNVSASEKPVRVQQMAGVILMGIPILGGLVGGTMLQVAMRINKLSLLQRVQVELAMMGVGSAAICLKPPGSAQKGENWMLFIFCGAMVTTGGFAMAEGAIVNVVPGGAATVLKVVGLLLVGCMAYCLWKRIERQSQRRGEGAPPAMYAPV
jgi:hypothetical protein